MILSATRRNSLLLLLAAVVCCLSSNRQQSQCLVDAAETKQNHLRSSSLQSSPPQNDRSLVIGGHDAVKNRYPYYVALQTADNNTECGGTLIAPDVVLTAAHCAKYVLKWRVESVGVLCVFLFCFVSLTFISLLSCNS